MKKIFLICLSLMPVSVMADMLPYTTVCTDNGWTEIFVQYKKSVEKPTSYRLSSYRSGFEVCILPDGKFYTPWQLERDKNDQHKNLFEQYSGKPPTAEQVEKIKEEFRQSPSGYIVN